MIFFLVVILVIVFGVYQYLHQPKFGKFSTNRSLENILASSNYREGKFQNLHDTPDLSEDANYFSIIRDMIFGRDKRNKPTDLIPSLKIDLHTLDKNENLLVWFGHSSYFLQIDGKTFLVDPVFSGNASPIPGTVKNFKGSNVYDTEDIPVIDHLLISHDHWDHLDYLTVKKLLPKVKNVVTGLGTAAHLIHWGYAPSIIEEKDWNEHISLGKGFSIDTVAARHFSGRTFKRQQSIWLSFVLTTPTKTIFIGGDSGYDSHFADIGKKFGPFDLAMLECGQYNNAWKYIHMMPEEVAQAASDLNTKIFMPVHWAKFALGYHAWDEPILRVTKAAKERSIAILTPMIGEKTDLNNIGEQKEWWNGLK